MKESEEYMQLNEAEIRMNRAEAKFKMLFELSPIGMAMVNHQTGDFMEVNKALLKQTGYTKDEFINLSYWDITPREYEDQENQQIEDLNKTGRFGPNEKEYIRKDGSRYPIEISGFMLLDVDGSKVVWGMIEDISERKKLEEELRMGALHDSLTGLANRRLLHQRLESSLEYCIREEKKLAVYMIDLDKFKWVNDNFGHTCGDNLLIEVALRMKSLVNRKIDTAARMGGDEFAMIATLIDKVEDADKLGQMICQALCKPFELEDRVVQLSASIGCSIFPNHGSTQDDLLTKADYAAYEVKKKGGNGYKVYSSN